MTDRNPYSQQYNFDTFDQPASTLRRRASSGEGGGIIGAVKRRLSSPLFAAGALLVTAAAFGTIIMLSYPDSQDAGDVPIIQADAGNIREAPAERGGFEVPHEDSTVFSTIRSADLQEEPPIEDLLAEEKPIDKLEAFAKEAESMFDADAVQPAAGGTEITENVPADEGAAAAAANDNAPKTMKIQETVEKIPLATIPAEGGTAPQLAHAAGSSPETLAFVKSVLNEKDGKPAAVPATPTEAINTKAAVTQPDAAKIEPAAGAADASKTIASGSFYVQLASITSENAAPKEWGKLQKAFGSLQSAQYRVQRADLGEKGVRYRIQAGPMSKDLAASVCDSIKAQKPGGCIVVR